MSGAGGGEVVSKEVGEEERGAQGRVDRRSDNATSVDVEIDPHRRRVGRSQTDFALQTTSRILFIGLSILNSHPNYHRHQANTTHSVPDLPFPLHGHRRCALFPSTL